MVQEKETWQTQGRSGKPGCSNNNNNNEAVVSSTCIIQLAGGVGNGMLGNGGLGGRLAAFKLSLHGGAGEAGRKGRCECVGPWLKLEESWWPGM